MVRAASDERRPGDGPRLGDAAPALRPDRLGYADGGRAGECVLVIGFDFGTSTSKVVVHAPFLQGAPQFLARRRDDGDWLWPSSFHEDENGVCDLDGGDTGRPHRGIKLDLMDAASAGGDTERSAEAEKAVAAYFGLMFRAVRTQILETHADVLRTFATLDWSLNVGVPSGTPETRSRDEPPREALRAAFRRAANAGWRLSLRDAPIRLKDAEQTLRSEEQADIDIDLFPEVIAGAYGYARSEERRDGLHLMMDVGAGTVDACLFRLRTKDEVENWPLLEARVERLGTAELHERRVAALRRVDEQEAEWLRRAYDPFDGTAPAPPTSGLPDAAYSAVEDADEGMTLDVAKLAGYLVKEAVTRRDPNAAEFKAGGSLPILRMGGGSRAEPYRFALGDLRSHLAKLLPTGQLGARVLDTPVPGDLDEKTEGMGYRFAVAVGLSQPSLDLPKHKRPSAIPDIPRFASERERRDPVGKEQV